jgi:spore maturation protein CgeB
MARHLRTLRSDPDAARELADRGRSTILSRHTCAHRVDELLHIVTALNQQPVPGSRRPAEPVGAV